MRHRALLAALLAIGLWGGAVVTAEPFALGERAPDIAGESWINSGPLTMAGLRGRVVLIDFWTYGCINCQHVIPQLREWHERHEKAGLTIIGVHTPEFLWEKPYDKVVAATRRLGVRYPVVQDNASMIWNRFAIRAWPTAVLVDRKGIVRYQHIGEGAYDETESMIRRLLAERE